MSSVPVDASHYDSGESLLYAAVCPVRLCLSEQRLNTTPGPTRHNIYSSQAANAAPSPLVPV